MLSLEETRPLAAKLSAVKEYGQFIGGAWVESHSKERIELLNPANGQVLARIPRGNAIDVDRAVKAAQAAFPSFAAMSARGRQEMFLEIAKRLERRKLDFAMMEALNNGKTINDAYFLEVPSAIGIWEYYAGAGFHRHGSSATNFPDATMSIYREPIGVVAQITPWNAALYIPCLKLATALAAGCTVVLKPAETVCVGLLEFIAEISDIVPPGVINVVNGYGRELGEPLVTHPLVRKVSFTGSRPTAQQIIKYASTNIIPQTMELGGKSANIVCEDADLDAAVRSVALCCAYNKGEVCLSGTRIFVHEKVEDAFMDKLKSAFEAIKLGDPVDPATGMGPQAFKGQFDKVCSYLEIGRKEGAKAAIGGGPAKVPGLENGFFVQPTAFTGVRNEMRIAQEEIFGPVFCVMRWKDEEVLLRQANESVYGLGGGIWTKDLTRAHRLSRGLETGMIWVNRYYNFRHGQPVSGYKQSGFGTEGSHESVEHYMTTKSIVINLNTEGDELSSAIDLT